MKYLRDLGFDEDELQPNSWIKDHFLLYQDHEGEFIFSTFEGGDIDIIQEEADLWLMKPFLCKYFKQRYREERLSSILDKNGSNLN